MIRMTGPPDDVTRSLPVRSLCRCAAASNLCQTQPRRVYINAESVCALLHAVAEATVGLPITLVLDNARYQKCAVVQALAASLGIELLYLPGYSPNLNLIERLWRFVRRQSLDSTYYASFEQVTAAIDECLDSLPTVHQSEMDTLLTHKFQMFGDVPRLAASSITTSSGGGTTAPGGRSTTPSAAWSAARLVETPLPPPAASTARRSRRPRSAARPATTGPSGSTAGSGTSWWTR